MAGGQHHRWTRSQSSERRRRGRRGRPHNGARREVTRTDSWEPSRRKAPWRGAPRNRPGVRRRSSALCTDNNRPPGAVAQTPAPRSSPLARVSLTLSLAFHYSAVSGGHGRPPLLLLPSEGSGGSGCFNHEPRTKDVNYRPGPRSALERPMGIFGVTTLAQAERRAHDIARRCPCDALAVPAATAVATRRLQASAGAAREGNCQMDNGAGGAVESYNQNRATPRFVRRVRNPGPLAPRRAPGLGANLAPPCPRPAARFTDF
ncbi:unnamed protein product [Lampetra fluviatilis]